MKKIGKIHVCVVFIFCFVLMAAACGAGGEPGIFQGKVRGTYSTLKVMRDASDYPSFDAAIDISMAKNETEGGQIVITPTADVQRWYLHTTDLKSSEGTVIEADRISVYVQRYIEVTEKTSGQTNAAYPTGYIPDMLLPIQLATREELSIKAGENQSVTVEVTTDADTKEGVYKGNFSLTLDQTTMNIPVAVTVWDIAIDKMYGKTCFGLDCCYLLRGELDSTWEQYIKYYETMLNDYKICANYVPYFDVSPEAMAESVVKYYDNPNFTSYSVPFFKLRPNQPKEINKDLLVQYLYALAKKCTKDKNLFEKCYLYMILNDEPYSQSDYEYLLKAIADVREAKQEVVEILDQENFFEGDRDWRESFAEELTTVAEVATCAYNDYTGDAVSGYCPRIYNYGTYYGRDAYRKSAAASKGEQWFYTAMELYPYPSCALDDYMIGNRILGWMKKAYGVDGYLYYNAAIYCNFVTGDMIDPYADPVRFSNASGGYPGDGYIFYPAIKYGAEKPIGSLRAVSYRDGQEDNAILNIVENAVSEAAKGYGIETDSYEILSRLYDKLFTGAAYVTDDNALVTARKELYAIYQNVRSEAGYIAVKNSVSGNRQSINVYLADGYDLAVNGENVRGETQGGGKKYTYEKSLLAKGDKFEIVVSKNGSAVITDIIYADMPRFDAVKYTAESVSDYIGISSESTLSYDEKKDENTVTLVSVGESFTEKMSFEPFFALKEKLFGGRRIDALGSISFTLYYGEASRNVQFKVRLRSSDSVYTLDTVTMVPNERITVTLKDFPAGDWTSIEFVTDNVNAENELLPDRVVTFGGITYTLK